MLSLRHYLVTFAAVYLTNDLMTVTRICRAELYLIKLRYFSLLATKCLQISKRCKEKHPVRAHEGNLGFSSRQPLYISTKLLSSLTIKFLVLLCPCEFSKFSTNAEQRKMNIFCVFYQIFYTSNKLLHRVICFLCLQVHEFCRIDGLVKLHYKPLLQLKIQQFLRYGWLAIQ